MARRSKQRKTGRATRAKAAKIGKASARVRRIESKAKMEAWEAMPYESWSDARKARNPGMAGTTVVAEVTEPKTEEGASSEGTAV